MVSALVLVGLMASPPVMLPKVNKVQTPAAAAPATAAAASASAAAPAAAPVRKKVVKRARPKKVEPEVPALPAPELRLTIDAPSPDGAWTMRAANAGKVPLAILADARLLVLDVTAPEAKKATRCELPATMRPRSDEDRTLVVPPGGAYVEKVDPRLFCFGARAGAALVPGAKVAARLVAAKPGPPAVAPIDGIEPLVASAPEWSAAEATIGPLPAAQTSPKAASPSRPLAIASTAYVDSIRGIDVVVTVTVTNVSPLPVRFLLRPETLAFDISGPSGVDVTDPSPTVHCSWAGEKLSPIAEVFTTLGPHQKAELSVMLSALCPDRTLDHPGLYAVRAKLDTRNASGAPIGITTFDGEVNADAPSRVRVQAWPGLPPPAPRPHIEEAKPSP